MVEIQITLRLEGLLDARDAENLVDVQPHVEMA